MESKIARPEDPIRSGYEFINWYTNQELNELFDFENTIVEKSVIIYAGWRKMNLDEFTVRFYDINGQILDTQIVKENESAMAPEAPVVEGFEFTGWSEPFEKVTSDLDIFSIYTIIEYVVLFLDSDGTILYRYECAFGNLIDNPELENITKEGYIFCGWKDVDGNDYHTPICVKGSLTLYAQWEKIICHNNQLKRR